MVTYKKVETSFLAGERNCNKKLSSMASSAVIHPCTKNPFSCSSIINILYNSVAALKHQQQLEHVLGRYDRQPVLEIQVLLLIRPNLPIWC